MNDFYEKLRYSLSEQQTFDCNILKSHIPNCIAIKKTDTATDKTGIDYIAELDGGAKIYIDAKTRTPGCSRYWRGEPELAIEMWSVVEKKKVGWTFSKKTNVDYILYTFPKEDYSGYFLFRFSFCVQLRNVVISNGKRDIQSIINKIMDIHHKLCLFLPVFSLRKYNEKWSAIK